MSDDLRARCAGSISRVDDNVYIGGYLAAASPVYAKRVGFTHILKLFEDDPSYSGGEHRHPGVTYLVVKADDVPEYPLGDHFQECLEFIQQAIRANGKILVHCHMGISRSATIVLLHLMINCGHSLDESLKILREKRPVVNPNPGFWEKLKEIDSRARRFRLDGKAPPRPDLGGR